MLCCNLRDYDSTIVLVSPVWCNDSIVTFSYQLSKLNHIRITLKTITVELHIQPYNQVVR